MGCNQPMGVWLIGDIIGDLIGDIPGFWSILGWTMAMKNVEVLTWTFSTNERWEIIYQWGLEVSEHNWGYISLVTSYHYQWQTRRSLWRSARFRTACGSRAVPLRHPQTLAWGWLLGMEPLRLTAPTCQHGREGQGGKGGGLLRPCWGQLVPSSCPPMLKACWDHVDLLRGRMSCKHRVIDHTWYA